MKKRLWSILLTLTMVIALFPGMTITANALSHYYPASDIRNKLTLAEGDNEGEYVVQGLLELQFECAYGKTFPSESEAQAARDTFCAVNNGQETQLFDSWTDWAKFDNDNDADLVVTADQGDSHLVFCCWYGTGNTTSSHCYAIIPLTDAAEARVAMLKVGATVVPDNYWMNQQGTVTHGEPGNDVQSYAYYKDSVLTLKDFTFNKDFFSFSKYWRDPNEYYPEIHLIGENTLGQSISTGHNLLITGATGASLTLNGGNIGFDKVTLTISNTTLNITNDSEGISASPGYVVIENSNVTISSNSSNAVKLGPYNSFGKFTVTGNSNVDLKSNGPALNVGKNGVGSDENIIIDQALSVIASTQKENGTFVDYVTAENANYKHIKIGKFIKDLSSCVSFNENTGKVTITKPEGATGYAYKVLDDESEIASLNELIGTVIGGATVSNKLNGYTPKTETEEVAALQLGDSLIAAIATYDGSGNITGIYAFKYAVTKDISAAVVTVGGNYVYNEAEHQPTTQVTVELEGAPLDPETDYTLSYSNNINAAASDSETAPTVTVTGKGLYSGTATQTFTIAPKPLSTENLEYTVAVSYNGVADSYTSDIKDNTGKDAPTTLVSGTDYSITTVEGTAAAPRKLKVTFQGNYTGEFTVENVPVQIPLLNAMFSVPTSTTYNGEAFHPAVTVTEQGENAGLTTNSDGIGYVVTYGNTNTNAGNGTGTVTITAQEGSVYSGSLNINLTINRATANVRMKPVTVTSGAALPEAANLQFELLNVIAGDDVTLNVADNYVPTFTIKAEDGTVIKDSSDQVISGLDNIWAAIKSKPGTYKIVWSGYNSFGANLTISGADVSNYNLVGLSDTTLTINAAGGKGSGGGGGGGGSTNVTVPVSNDNNKVNVNADVSGSDANIKPLDNQQINQIVGDTKAAGDVVVDLTGLGKNIDTAGIPKATLEAIVDAAEDAGNDTEHLVIKLSTAELKLDDAAMRAIVEQAKGDVIKFNFDDVGTTRLNNKQKNAVKELNVRKGFEAYITVNGQRVSDFKGGEVEIVVPYAVPAGESIAGFSVWYIDEQGKLEKQKSTYDGKEKCFVVSHFSDYVIAYDAEAALAGSYHNCPKDATCPIHPYTDASTTAWYHDGVHYCIDHGIMNGYGNGIFKPNGTVTRQQIWLTLARISGEKPADAAEARAWAMANGVSDGTNPTKAVTRQQFITMLYRYAVSKGYDVSVGEETNILSYTDAFDVAEYAIPAVQWSCGSGVMGGYTDGTLKPVATTTRAHLAAFLQRFCVDVVK